MVSERGGGEKSIYEIKVHYVGWNKRYDTFLSVDRLRLVPTSTAAATIQKSSSTTVIIKKKRKSIPKSNKRNKV